MQGADGEAKVQSEYLQQLDGAIHEVFQLVTGRVCIPCEAMQPVDVTGTLKSLGGRDAIAARVNFSGSLTGAYVLYLSRRSAVELTMEFMDVTPTTSLPDHLLFDTVGELCNMIAGSWKSRLAPPLSCCNLSPPAPVTELGDPGDCIRPGLFRTYRFTPHTLLAQLSLG